MQSVLFFTNNPPVDGLLLLGEVDADLYELSAVGGEGERVVFGVNLCQGFSGRLVVLSACAGHRVRRALPGFSRDRG